MEDEPKRMPVASPVAEKNMTATRRWSLRLVYGVYLIVVVALLAELGLRFIVGTEATYYTGFGDPEPNAVVTYPYGEIRFNSNGFPDDEFRRKLKPRVAYVGDSVCYGVGAGYGFRVTELLDQRLPQYDHMNFGLVAYDGIQGEQVNRLLERVVAPYDVDQVVYLMNLNDILPDRGEMQDHTLWAKSWRSKLDWLRGKSLLYTQLRTIAKTYYVRKGYGVHGAMSFELFPDANEWVIRATAERVNDFGRRLAERGVAYLVVLLPYEMQISQEAARKYEELGITWDGEAFINRGPQKALLRYFDPSIPVVDAYYAFVGAESDVGESRARNALGQYFVYNKGDRLDWNHPNREGHRVIAEYLAASGAIGP